jgi:hypothetical protein
MALIKSWMEKRHGLEPNNRNDAADMDSVGKVISEKDGWGIGV